MCGTIGIFHAITNATPQEINRYHREYYDCFALPCDSSSYLPNKRTRNLRGRYKTIPNDLIEYKVIFSNLFNSLKTPHIFHFLPYHNDSEGSSDSDSGHSSGAHSGDAHSSDRSGDSSSNSSSDDDSGTSDKDSVSKTLNNENLNIIFTQLIDSITGMREPTTSMSESNSHSSSPSYVISKSDIDLNCLLAKTTTLPEYTLYHHTTPLISSVCKGVEASTFAALPQCLQVCSDSAIELLRHGYKYDDCVIPAIVITGIYVEVLCVYLLADSFPVITSLSRLLPLNTYEGICALSKWVIALKHFALETVSLQPLQQHNHQSQYDEQSISANSDHTWQSTPEERVCDNSPVHQPQQESTSSSSAPQITPPYQPTTTSIETKETLHLPSQPQQPYTQSEQPPQPQQCTLAPPLITPYTHTYIALDFSQYFFKPLKLVADSGNNNRYQISAKNDVSNLIYKRNLYMYIYQKLSEIKYAYDVILFPVGVMSLPSKDNPYCGTTTNNSNCIHNTTQSPYVEGYTHAKKQHNNTSCLYNKLESHINQYFPLLEVSLMTHTPILIYPLLHCTATTTTTITATPTHITTVTAASPPTTTAAAPTANTTWSSDKPSAAYRADYIKKVALAVSILNEAGVAHMVGYTIV